MAQVLASGWGRDAWGDGAWGSDNTTSITMSPCAGSGSVNVTATVIRVRTATISADGDASVTRIVERPR